MIRDFLKFWREKRAKDKRRKAFDREVTELKAWRKVFRVVPCGTTQYKVEFHSFNHRYLLRTKWTQLGVFSSKMDAQTAIRKGIKLDAERTATYVVEAQRRYFEENASYEYPETHSAEFEYSCAYGEHLATKQAEFINTLTAEKQKEYYNDRY